MSRLSQYIDSKRFPNLRMLFETQIDMQLEDVRAMMKLPSKEISAGMNLSATSILCSLIAGSSVVLYEASARALDDGAQRGQRFRGVIEKYFPFEGETLAKSEIADVLYQLSRNPLAHSFAIPNSHFKKFTYFIKDSLAEEDLVLLDQVTEKPKNLHQAIFKKRGLKSEAYVLYVPELYWSVRRMIFSLITDDAQCKKSEVLASKINKSMAGIR